MAPSLCEVCNATRALILRPKTHQKVCKGCFIAAFESEIHNTITAHRLFEFGERVAIGASGGKDSTVLASVLSTLNKRHNYGLDLVLLSIDEGIHGYRDDSLETVKRNAVQYDLPLEILGYKELYGWTMDEVVAQTGGGKGNCTYCGVFRRQALDRGASRLQVNHVVTGHNADDVAETVMMNLLRGDLPRLSRATSIITSSASSSIKRSKPLKYAYEKEIVLYAHHKKLDYFSTECIYSPEAFRGSARTLIKNLERIRPSAILDVIKSGEDMARCVPPEVTGEAACAGQSTSHIASQADVAETGGCGGSGARATGSEMAAMERKLAEDQSAEQRDLEHEVKPVVGRRSRLDQIVDSNAKPKPGPKTKKLPKQRMGQCIRCGYLSSQAVCKACMLLEGLNKSQPKTEIQVALDDEESSSTLMRSMERMELTGASGS